MLYYHTIKAVKGRSSVYLTSEERDGAVGVSLGVGKREAVREPSEGNAFMRSKLRAGAPVKARECRGHSQRYAP